MIAEQTAPDGIRSFRDPAGFVVRHRGRILRVVRAAEDLDAFLATHAARTAMDSGRLVRSVRIPADEFPELHADYLIEHEPVPFPSYPYEWPPEMLYAAARLTLELAQAAAPENFGVKDATPYNVLFRGSEP